MNNINRRRYAIRGQALIGLIIALAIIATIIAVMYGGQHKGVYGEAERRAQMTACGEYTGQIRQAIMTGDNTAMPMLDTLSQVVTLHPGDQVVSSGDGGLLPPGLAIGTVEGSPGAYRVLLLADASSSEDVEVLAFRKPAETLPATSPGQLPAVAAGLPPAAPPPAPVPAAPKPLPQAATAQPVPAQAVQGRDD